MLKIAFFGTHRLAQIVLEKLIESPYKPALVITASDTKAGRGQKLKPSPVKETTKKYKFKIFQPTSLSDQNWKFDIAILVAYGKIIPRKILSIPKYGFINIHPSILPKYRGPSPIQSAILTGDKKTGVSIMILDEIVDHGPILAQQEVAIAPNDTHASLVEKLGQIGADLLLNVLPLYLAHSRSESKVSPQIHSGSVFLPSKPQDHKKATFTKKITKADGQIDPNDAPNQQALDRMIRAFYPWPGTWCRFPVKGSPRTRTSSVRGKRFTVKLLPNKMLQPEGKRPMSVKEFLNGYPQAKRLLENLQLI